TRISTRLLHVYSYGALLFGLILTAIAPSNQGGWLIFLAGRIVTAIAVGLMMPLLQIIIIYMFPIKQRGTAMGLSGLAVGLA
ncbi:MFS transporter, partial [Staphylococcus aureus]|nr:MFS transporter [Staphylococcus aureus]